MNSSEVIKTQEKHNVMRSAVAMSLGTLASRILGFVRDAIMLALFDRTTTDAFAVAFKLPNFFRRILGEGSLAVSFVPVYIDHLSGTATDPAGASERAKRLSSSLYTLLTMITLVLTAVCTVWMEPLLNLWVGDPQGFASIPGKLEQTIYLARIMFAYLYLVTMYAFFMALANAHKKFFLPGVAPALFNLIVIIFALLPKSWSQVPGDLLAWGVIAGGIVQAGVVILTLWPLKVLPRLRLDWRAPGFQKVLLNVIPGLLGLGIFQVMSIVNVKYAAQLEEGAQSYIYAGDRLLELPQSLIAISLGAALLPAFSSLIASGQREAMVKSCNKYLRVQFFLSLPSAVGLFLLALPIVQLLFQRGAFNAQDAEMTAAVTQVYAWLLVCSSASKVISPGFYAIKNTWLPALVAGICVSIHIVIAYFWVRSFGVVGIVSSTALTGFLNMFLLLMAFRHFIGPIGGWEVWRGVLRMLPPLGIMGAFLYYGHPLLESFMIQALPFGHGYQRALGGVSVMLVIGASIPLYFLSSLAMGSEEAREVLGVIRRRRMAKS